MRALLILALALASGCGDAQASSSVDVTVDVSGPSRRISPYVYGINGTAHTEGMEGVFTVVRFGGTRTTTYNWENNASNAGHDWPANQNDGYLSASTDPGAAVTETLDVAQRLGAAAIVTVPMIGHVAADRNADGDVGESRDYLETRFVRSVARGGSDRPSLDDRVVHQDAFVRFVYREAQRRGVRVFFALDNESAAWPVSQPRLREGRPLRYDEIAQKGVAYAAMIHDEAPDALVLGPVTFGWPDMTTLAGAPDARDRDFLSFYLDHMRQAERRRGRRLLDVLDVHWYPDAQAGGERVNSASERGAVARLRMQLPRSLYDEEYEEPSWIAEDVGAVRLIPRLRETIAEHYPGTHVAITEWAYGAGAHPSGAVATADALGAFGRYGVHTAAYWPLFGQEHDYALAAFRMYRRIDGEVSFGDRSIDATTSHPAQLGAWASVDSRARGRVVIVLTGRIDRAFTAKLSLRGASGPLRRFVLDGRRAEPRELDPISRSADGTYAIPIPRRSVTTLIGG